MQTIWSRGYALCPSRLRLRERCSTRLTPTLPQPATDQNVYNLGEITGRNIGIACLPSGVYGTVSAAVVV
jgi:hypothetical protein